MHHAGFRRPSKPAIFAMLMAASAVLVLLPKDVLRPTRNMTQLMAPLQIAAHEAGRGVAGALTPDPARSQSPEQREASLRRYQATENENASLRQELAQLRAELCDLAGIRARGLSDRVNLLPARVIGPDAAPGRASLLVTGGHTRGIEPGDWVSTRLFADAGTEQGVTDGTAVLAREYLIGWVDQAAPFTSRVMLLSDSLNRRPLRVHIAPSGRGQQVLAKDGEPMGFVLQAGGWGHMRIPDVPANLVESGWVRVGDRITSDPRDARLPAPMVIGLIAELVHNKEKRLYYDAVVDYPYDPKTLGRVYIVDLSCAPGEKPDP